MGTNNLVGTYEFIDFPMLEAGLEHLGVAAGKHIPGAAVHEYLVKFAAKDNITPRIRPGLHRSGRSGGRGQRRRNQAAGLDPDGGNPWRACLPIMQHARRRLRHLHDAAPAPPARAMRHVTVVGASKSAYDAVYMFARAGRRVTRVIRRAGNGARHTAPPQVYLGPFRKRLEDLLLTRPLDVAVAVRVRRRGRLRPAAAHAVHGTRAGNWLVRRFFASSTRDKLAQAGFLADPKLRPLIPRLGFFWHASQLGNQQ